MEEPGVVNTRAPKPRGWEPHPGGGVDALGGQLERAEVHADALGPSEIDVRLHRLLRIHVHGLHEPARLVGADGHQGQVERTEPPADVAEERAIRGVAGEVDPRAGRLDHESAPQRTIAIEAARAEKCWAGVSVIGTGARFECCHQSSSSMRWKPVDATSRRLPSGVISSGIELRGEHRERVQVAMVVVVVAEQHDRDRRQVVEPDRRLPHALRSEAIERAGPLRIHRVGEDVAERGLDQERRVADEGDVARGAVERRRQARAQPRPVPAMACVARASSAAPR